MPDLIYTPFDELQARAGIPTIEEQNARRFALSAEIDEMEGALAPLASRYGYTSSYWDAERTVQKSMCLMLARNDVGDARVTDKVLEAMAHVHPVYRKWLGRTDDERTQYNVQRAKIEGKKRVLKAYEDEVARATAMIRFAANEPR